MLTWILVGIISTYIGLGVYLLVAPYDRANDLTYAVYGSSAFFSALYIFLEINPVVFALMVGIPFLVWVKGLTSEIF